MQGSSSYCSSPYVSRQRYFGSAASIEMQPATTYDDNRILIEGGPATVARFLEARCLDRLHVVVAPIILGLVLGELLELTDIRQRLSALPHTHRIVTGELRGSVPILAGAGGAQRLNHTKRHTATAMYGGTGGLIDDQQTFVFKDDGE